MKVDLYCKENAPMRATIRQVAQRAGVSPMTVSNVIRDRAGQMGEETRRRVLKAIHELDYVPVRTAAQNRHVVTNAIGVVFLQEMQGAVGYPTFLGMCSRARQTDQDLTIFLRSEPDWVKPGTEAQFLDRRCDGFIFVGANRPEISEALVRHRVPVVECYSVSPPAGVVRVLGDNADVMHKAVQHLAALGHRRIAHIAGPQDDLEARERHQGFLDAMQEAGLPAGADCIVQADTWGDLWGFGAGHDGAQTRPVVEAALKLDVTAVVCANDLFALALWRLAEEQGLCIPQDLSIVGVDNIVEGMRRGLTSVALPFEQIGRTAVDAILTLVEGGKAAEIGAVLPVELIPRLSSGRPPLLPR